jgi:hypothetical protein
LFAYLYRIDLRQLAGITDLPCVLEFEIDWKAPVIPVDYDDDAIEEDIFVITSGGLGTVGPVSADKTSDKITFDFNPPVCAGSFAGGGESSFFFGLASITPPAIVEARLRDTMGAVTVVEARSPRILIISEIKELLEFIGSLDSSDFSRKQYQALFVNQVEVVEKRVDRGADNLCKAVDKLANDVLPKTDGDPSQRDWISDRAAQMQIEDMTTELIRSIQRQADELRGCR